VVPDRTVCHSSCGVNSIVNKVVFIKEIQANTFIVMLVNIR